MIARRLVSCLLPLLPPSFLNGEGVPVQAHGIVRPASPRQGTDSLAAGMADSVRAQARGLTPPLVEAQLVRLQLVSGTGSTAGHDVPLLVSHDRLGSAGCVTSSTTGLSATTCRSATGAVRATLR